MCSYNAVTQRHRQHTRHGVLKRNSARSSVPTTARTRPTNGRRRGSYACEDMPVGSEGNSQCGADVHMRRAQMCVACVEHRHIGLPPWGGPPTFFQNPSDAHTLFSFIYAPELRFQSVGGVCRPLWPAFLLNLRWCATSNRWRRCKLQACIVTIPISALVSLVQVCIDSAAHRAWHLYDGLHRRCRYHKSQVSDVFVELRFE